MNELLSLVVKNVFEKVEYEKIQPSEHVIYQSVRWAMTELKNKRIQGASNLLVASFAKQTSTLHISKIGDTGYWVLRPNHTA